MKAHICQRNMHCYAQVHIVPNTQLFQLIHTFHRVTSFLNKVTKIIEQVSYQWQPHTNEAALISFNFPSISLPHLFKCFRSMKVFGWQL